MLILVYLSVGRKDIMKTGYTFFYIFESARLQGEALHRRRDCTGGRCTAYGIVQAVAEPPMYAMLSLKKGATASARTTQSPYEQGNSYE